MSIFGPNFQSRNTKNDNQNNDLELKINDFYNRVQRQNSAVLGKINDYENKHNLLINKIREIESSQQNFQQEVHNQRGQMVVEINTNRDRHKALQDKIKEIAIKQHLNTGKIERLKSYVTITAESKGPLKLGEIFSFGNAGKTSKTGYVMMKNGYIVSMGLSCDRSQGEIKIQTLIDKRGLREGELILREGISEDNVTFTKPFRLIANNVINFISLIDNGSTINTVVSLLIELD